MNTITHTFIASHLEQTMGSHCTVQVRELSPGESTNLRLSLQSVTFHILHVYNHTSIPMHLKL